jgi:hypothetical protein
MTTHTQDPADRFTLLTEEVRRIAAAHGPRHGLVGCLHFLLLDIFLCIISLLASHAERVHAGNLPDTAPARCQDASPRPERAPNPPGVPAPGALPRQRDQLRHWMPETHMSGGQPGSPLRQPDMLAVSAATPQVEPPAKPRLPRPICVLKLKEISGPPLARPRDDDAWPLRRRSGLPWRPDAGFSTLNSQKAGLGAGNSCVQFVTMSQRCQIAATQKSRGAGDPSLRHRRNRQRQLALQEPRRSLFHNDWGFVT